MRDYIKILMANGFSADAAYLIYQDFLKNMTISELEEYIQSISYPYKGGSSCG